MDLIICYDSAASPTRSTQRMGRTGRHKEGRVVYILTAGRELETYHANLERTKRIQASRHAMALSLEGVGCLACVPGQCTDWM